jgi:hypothetical protein
VVLTEGERRHYGGERRKEKGDVFTKIFLILSLRLIHKTVTNKHIQYKIR